MPRRDEFQVDPKEANLIDFTSKFNEDIPLEIIINSTSVFTFKS